jgi:hypothetical protein
LVYVLDERLAVSAKATIAGIEPPLTRSGQVSFRNAGAGGRGLFRRAGRARVARLLRVYPDSSERLNDLTVRVRSLLANSAATGFINRIKPKSSPSAT